MSAVQESAEAIARSVETYFAEHEAKDLVRFVVVGSVDDGKSTLIGRLLYEAQGLYEDQISSVKRASQQKQAGGEIDFSLFTDGLRAEREQGITIDVAYRSFATARRRFILADTPGHEQYTRNMATGASTADVGVILIDARLGVLPQTRRHAFIASLLGIPRLAVAINKIDLVGFDPAIFERIRAEFQALAAALRFEQVAFFPISATLGDNVVTRSERTPWYDGPTLLELLETVPVARDRQGEPMRFPVQYVIRPHLGYRGFAGQLAAGTVRAGDEVVVLPSGRRTRVAGIDTFDGSLVAATAPMSVAIRLADEVDVSRGDLIARPHDAPRVERRFEAMLVWLNERPLDPKRRYLLKHTTRVVPAEVEQVRWRVDLATLGQVPAERLELNDIARVVVQCRRPILFDAYARSRSTGAFILIDALTNDTVAAGMISEEGMGERALEADAEASRVSPDERHGRLGQQGGLVHVNHADERTAHAFAYELERALFDRGWAAAVIVANPDAAVAAAQAGLLVISVGAGSPEERERLRAEARASEWLRAESSAGEGSLAKLVERLGTPVR